MYLFLQGNANIVLHSMLNIRMTSLRDMDQHLRYSSIIYFVHIRKCTVCSLSLQNLFKGVLIWMTSTDGSGIWNQLLSCTSNCSHIISLNKHGFLVSIGLHVVAWVRFNVWICSLSPWQLFGGTTLVAMDWFTARFTELSFLYPNGRL